MAARCRTGTFRETGGHREPPLQLRLNSQPMDEHEYGGNAAATKRLVSLAETLLARGGTLESNQGSGPIDRQELAAALENRILSDDSISSELPSTVTAKAAALQALAQSESALRRVANDGSPTNLTDLEVSALEAIIEVTGRPALRYLNGKVQPPNSLLGENGHWQVLILTARNAINKASASVGKISNTNNLGLPEGLGTGWRVGADMIVTNRHVVEAMVSNPAEEPSKWKLDAGKKSFVDFAVTDNSAGSKRFDIASLLLVAPEDDIDLAILSLAPATLPEPLTLDWQPDAVGRELPQANGNPPVFQGREIYVVGHPFRRRHSELVVSVFGVADGMKRLSPGLVKSVDPGKPILEHDCSTLGGNSGSCVFTADTHEVIALHVGGLGVAEETAKGRANLAIPISRLQDHKAAEIIRD